MLKDREYFLSEMPAWINELPAYEEPIKIRHFKEGLLHEAIKLLPQRKRQVVDLCKFQGKSYAEAGSILGIKKDTVKEYLVDSLKFIERYILSKEAS
jgi:RNA polymerase sigma-70 factor (ECF subfamily)